MKISPRRHTRSFSLVEIIVALAVLTIAFAGSMSLYYTSAGYSRSSADRSEARAQGYAEIALLRATLRNAPFIAGGTDNRATLFTNVITVTPTLQGPPGTIQPFLVSAGGTTFTRTQVATINRGRTTLTIVTTCYFSETLGETNLGLTPGTLDLNADGAFDGATATVAAIQPADMWALPVTVSVSWTTTEGQGAIETIVVNGVLY